MLGAGVKIRVAVLHLSLIRLAGDIAWLKTQFLHLKDEDIYTSLIYLLRLLYMISKILCIKTFVKTFLNTLNNLNNLKHFKHFKQFEQFKNIFKNLFKLLIITTGQSGTTLLFWIAFVHCSLMLLPDLVLLFKFLCVYFDNLIRFWILWKQRVRMLLWAKTQEPPPNYFGENYLRGIIGLVLLIKVWLTSEKLAIFLMATWR